MSLLEVEREDMIQKDEVEMRKTLLKSHKLLSHGIKHGFPNQEIWSTRPGSMHKLFNSRGFDTRWLPLARALNQAIVAYGGAP